MTSGKFDPRLFFQEASNVALHVEASELFGLLSRSLDLPAQWAALVRRSTGDQVVVEAGGVVDGADVEDVLFFRVTPIEISFDEDGVVTRDRFSCKAVGTLHVSVMPERGELVSFSKSVVGSHRVAQAKGLTRYLEPALRTALAKVAAAHDGAELVGGRVAQQVSNALADGVQAPLFAAGMVLEGAPEVRFDSQTLRHVQDAHADASRRRAVHEAEHEVRQALDRAQAEHLDHLGQLLGRLRDMASASPDVALPDLVKTFAERERGELYAALFANEPVADRTRWVVVAAGDELLFFDPSTFDEPARRVQIAGGVGGVRSTQSAVATDGTPMLWLGASTGVYRLPLDASTPDLTLVVEGTPSVQGGFNAVVAVGDRVFASHSELGLCEWNVNKPGDVRYRLSAKTKNAKAVRGVAMLDGNLYCSIDDNVHCVRVDDVGDEPSRVFTGSVSTVSALCPTTDGLFAGNRDGDVLFWSSDSADRVERIHTGAQRAVESIWHLSTHGVRRLVYSDTSLHVHARVLGDSFSCRYEAGGQTLRRVEVAADLVIATNDLRDRLICWTPGDPEKPNATIGVSRICGRSVQDVCLVRES